MSLERSQPSRQTLPRRALWALLVALLVLLVGLYLWNRRPVQPLFNPAGVFRSFFGAAPSSDVGGLKATRYVYSAFSLTVLEVRLAPERVAAFARQYGLREVGGGCRASVDDLDPARNTRFVLGTLELCHSPQAGKLVVQREDR